MNSSSNLTIEVRLNVDLHQLPLGQYEKLDHSEMMSDDSDIGHPGQKSVSVDKINDDHPLSDWKKMRRAGKAKGTAAAAADDDQEDLSSQDELQQKLIAEDESILEQEMTCWHFLESQRDSEIGHIDNKMFAEEHEASDSSTSTNELIPSQGSSAHPANQDFSKTEVLGKKHVSFNKEPRMGDADGVEQHEMQSSSQKGILKVITFEKEGTHIGTPSTWQNIQAENIVNSATLVKRRLYGWRSTDCSGSSSNTANLLEDFFSSSLTPDEFWKNEEITLYHTKEKEEVTEIKEQKEDENKKEKDKDKMMKPADLNWYRDREPSYGEKLGKTGERGNGERQKGTQEKDERGETFQRGIISADVELNMQQYKEENSWKVEEEIELQEMQNGFLEKDSNKRDLGSNVKQISYFRYLRESDRMPKFLQYVRKKFYLKRLEGGDQGDCDEEEEMKRETDVEEREAGEEEFWKNRSLQWPEVDSSKEQRRRRSRCNVSYNNNAMNDETIDEKATASGRRQETKLAQSCSAAESEGGKETAGADAPSGNLESEASKTSSSNLRQRLCKSGRKISSPDKSKSVAGSSQDRVWQDESEEGASSETRWRKGIAFFARSAQLESSNKEGEDEPNMTTTTSTTAATIFGSDVKLKKPKRKFSLNVFRKSSQGRFNEEAEAKDCAVPKSKTRAADFRQKDESKERRQTVKSGDDDHENLTEKSGIKKAASDTVRLAPVGAQRQNNLPEAFVKMETTGKEAEGATDVTQPNSGNEVRVIDNIDFPRDSSEEVIVPLEAKSSLLFHDAVFYFPRKISDEAKEPVATQSEGKVTKTKKKKKQSKSSSTRLMFINGTLSENQEEPTEKQTNVLKRMKAFFGRSGGSSSNSNSCIVGTTQGECNYLTNNLDNDQPSVNMRPLERFEHRQHPSSDEVHRSVEKERTGHRGLDDFVLSPSFVSDDHFLMNDEKFENYENKEQRRDDRKQMETVRATEAEQVVRNPATESRLPDQLEQINQWNIPLLSKSALQVRGLCQWSLMGERAREAERQKSTETCRGDASEECP